MLESSFVMKSMPECLLAVRLAVRPTSRQGPFTLYVTSLTRRGPSADRENVLKWDHERTEELYSSGTIRRLGKCSQVGP
jgi:hypothetical protein